MGSGSVQPGLRAEARASDIDLMVITTRPRFYVSTREWLQELGEPLLACLFSTVVGTRPVISVEFDRGVASLPETFGGYDDANARRSLFATLDLFSFLGRETAVRTNRIWPDAVENRVREWVQGRFDGSRAAGPTADPAGQ